jgi:hypothetical protein
MNNYEKKIKREKRWYIQPGFQADHFLNSPLFYSLKRHEFNYDFLRQRMAFFISQRVRGTKSGDLKILIAPIGAGADIKYVKNLSNDISGVDISEKALGMIPDSGVKKYAGDIKHMDMFPDNHFDIVIVPLFFHHFAKFGLEDFLKEARRVMKLQGLFFTLEPSSLYPFSWLAWLGKKIFGNITGLVDDEAPLFPFFLAGVMERCGFRDVKFIGASFTHNRFPVWLAKINNAITSPFAKIPIINSFAWMCLFYGKK